jgi:hypothetical protein
MRAPIEWTCPECGMSNRLLYNSQSQLATMIVTCDQEIGGCDTDCAIRVMFTPQITVYRLQECSEQKGDC